MNFARQIFFELRIFLRKIPRNFPPKFLSLYSVGQKKIPQNSRQNSHQISQISLRKIQKKESPTSFCRSAGRTYSYPQIMIARDMTELMHFLHLVHREHSGSHSGTLALKAESPSTPPAILLNSSPEQKTLRRRVLVNQLSGVIRANQFA